MPSWSHSTLPEHKTSFWHWPYPLKKKIAKKKIPAVALSAQMCSIRAIFNAPTFPGEVQLTDFRWLPQGE